MMAAPKNITPERVALANYNSQCLKACSQFYNDSPEKNLERGCQVVENLFAPGDPVQCIVKQGQEKYPTSDEYTVDALLHADGLMLDKTEMGHYRELLGPRFPQLEARIQAGEVELGSPYRYKGYKKYREQYGAYEALKRYVADVVGHQTDDEVANLLTYACEPIDLNVRNKVSYRQKQIADFLIRQKISFRQLDANNMAADIMRVYPVCAAVPPPPKGWKSTKAEKKRARRKAITEKGAEEALDILDEDKSPRPEEREAVTESSEDIPGEEYAQEESLDTQEEEY